MKTVTKIVRLKLCGSPQEVSSIFKDVEEKTSVNVHWEPGKLSNGIKKESVIKLCGCPEGVKVAREMILQNLETQCNRVTVKMDITHEEHPSLIGKRGALNKQVMEATSCLIHYPDINLRASTVKSNQVSITGEPINVEKARVMLRTLMPFQITFDVDPANSQCINTSLPLWKQIEQQLGLDIRFTRDKNSMLVTLKCSQSLYPTIRHQMLALIELLSQKRGSDLPPVKVYMDVMPQNHNFVKGTKGSNIQAIANRTGAKLWFNDSTSEISERRKIIIVGNLDSVYMAWQEVMSCLPVCVSFDVSETRETNNGYSDLLLDCNISVTTKAKQRYIKGVLVKGPEKFCKQMIQYRQRVLNLAPIKFQPDIDHGKLAYSFISSNANVANPPFFQNINTTSSDTNIDYQNILNFLNARNLFQTENSLPQALVTYNTPAYSPVTYIDVPIVSDKLCERHRVHNLPSSTVLPVYGNSSCPLWVQQGVNNNEAVVEQPHEQSHEQSGSFSNIENRHSSHSLTDLAIDEFEIFKKRLSAYEAIHRQIESTQVPSSIWAGYGFSQSMPAAFTTKDKEPLNRHSSTSLESNNSSSSEDSFSSIIFSDYFDDNIWSNHADNPFSLSNVFDFKTNTSLPTKFNHKDILPEILFKKGLYNYIDIFLREEIDYTAFLLLNESDLINLGINYQARMKITCLIRELQDNNLKTFDAAPGAGRKLNP